MPPLSAGEPGSTEVTTVGAFPVVMGGRWMSRKTSAQKPKRPSQRSGLVWCVFCADVPVSTMPKPPLPVTRSCRKSVIALTTQEKEGGKFVVVVVQPKKKKSENASCCCKFFTRRAVRLCSCDAARSSANRCATVPSEQAAYGRFSLESRETGQSS